MLELVGRSSSHFTRVARIFAHELEVPHTFRPVLDLATTEIGNYAGNPALKIPVLVLPEGPLFGAENICGELVRRAAARARVVQRGDIPDRVLLNAEELTLHAMSSGVSLIMAKLAQDPRLAPPKVRESLENALRYLDDNLEHALRVLPRERALSFFEVALYCLVRHLPFRDILDVRSYERLQAFCAGFDERDSAQRTTYRFDAP